MTNVSLSLNIILLVVLSFASPSISFAEKLMCSEVLTAFQKAKKIPLSEFQVNLLGSIMEGVANTTTGRRQEAKLVVTHDTVSASLNKLSRDLSRYGSKVEMRETPQEGHANWTETYYTTPFKYSIENVHGEIVEKTVKVRVRSYLEENLSSGSVKRLDITKNKKFLEIKAQNPDHKFTSDKARALLSDASIEKLLSQKLSLTEMQLIKDEIYNEPTFNRELIESNQVDNFIAFFQSIPFEAKHYRQKYVTTTYQRQAYRIKLNSANSTIDVQLTVDREINMKKGTDGIEISRYPDQSSVVEIKVPVEYAQMGPEQIAQVPALAAIKSFTDVLATGVMDGYTINKGKFSTSINSK